MHTAGELWVTRWIDNMETESMIEMVATNIQVPLIVGGGITHPEKAYLNCKAGAKAVGEYLKR